MERRAGAAAGGLAGVATHTGPAGAAAAAPERDAAAAGEAIGEQPNLGARRLRLPRNSEGIGGGGGGKKGVRRLKWFCG